MKHLFVFLFTVRVFIPMAGKIVYNNVEKINAFNTSHYTLTLSDGRTILVPSMFTIIEEQTNK